MAEQSQQINLRVPTEFDRLWAAMADMRNESKAELFRSVLLDFAWKEIQVAVARQAIAIHEVNAVHARASEPETSRNRWAALFDGYADLFGKIFERCPDYYLRSNAESEQLRHNFLESARTPAAEGLPAGEN